MMLTFKIKSDKLIFLSQLTFVYVTCSCPVTYLAECFNHLNSPNIYKIEKLYYRPRHPVLCAGLTR